MRLHQRAETAWYEREEARARLRRHGPVYTPAASLPHQSQAVAVMLPRSDPNAWHLAKRRRFEIAPSGRGCEDQELLRKQTLVKALWAIVEEFPHGSAKTVKINACWPSVRAEFVANVQSRLTTFSVSALSNALNAWRRYNVFLHAIPEKPAPLPASPAVISVFLASVARGDPRARTGKARKTQEEHLLRKRCAMVYTGFRLTLK